VQQAFVNAYEAMLRNDSELQLRPWLYRIAHNTALNGLRDRALRHTELPDGLDGVERPDEALERAQGLRQLLAAVQALPERQRNAIVLRELEGRSYDEIASELRVSGGSVRQLLHRARSTLRTAASAVTPNGLLTRMPWGAPAEPVAVRVAELCGMGAGGAIVAKVCATALVTGAVAGGVAVAPGGDGAERAVGPDKAAASGDAHRGAAIGPASDDGGGEIGFGGGGYEDRSGRDADDRSGPGDGDTSGSGGDSSGSGSDSSGSGSSGSGSSGSDIDNSGSGSDSSGSGSGDSGSDSSGSGSSGSGSDDSGSGSSGSGTSGSGSGDSGSGSSGSGSGDSGSGSSGSGTSGSGSGTSGSGSLESSISGSDGSYSDSSGSGTSGTSGSGTSGSGTELDTYSDGSGSSGSG
jgi:RNA polymerase sigma factor (sigma-70 family)